MVSYAVAGASRGMGLEFVLQLAAKPDATVFALVRNASSSTHLTTAIEGKTNVHVIEADIANFVSLESAAKAVSQVTGGTLDCLIHNAARMNWPTLMRGFDDFASMDEFDEECITDFKVNSLGVVHSVAAFLPLLRASSASLKKIVSLSTGGADPGCVKAFGIGHMAAYGMSKSAGLMATTKWALKLKDEGFVVISMNPGVVDTSETADPAARELMKRISSAIGIPMQTPAQSVAAQLKVVEGLKPSDNGLFMNYDGNELKAPPA